MKSSKYDQSGRVLAVKSIESSSTTAASDDDDGRESPHRMDSTHTTSSSKKTSTGVQGGGGKVGEQRERVLDHIATRGLREGLGFDVTVSAFGVNYQLHRLILMRSKFFESLFEGRWCERGSDQVALDFDADPFVSRQSFETVIACIYGLSIAEAAADEGEDEDEGKGQEKGKVKKGTGGGIGGGGEKELNDEKSVAIDKDSHPQHRSSSSSLLPGGDSKQGKAPAVEVEVVRPDPGRITKSNVLNVLACAVYFGVEELCQQCTTYVVREMVTMEHVGDMARFCEAHTYFPWTDKIEDACKTFLRRNVWDNPMATCYAVLERLPARWLLEVLASDSLWIPNEWERYKLCRRAVFHRHVLAQCRRHQHRQQRASHVDCGGNGDCDGGGGGGGGGSGSSELGHGPAAVNSVLDDTGETGSTSDVETLRDSTLPRNEPSMAIIDTHDALPDVMDKTRSPEDGDDDGDDDGDEGVSDEDDGGDSSEDGDETIYQEIFSTGIHYMFIAFELLQQIALDVDPVTGKPFVESQVLHKAFWQQKELRSRVEKSKSDTTELGIHVTPQNNPPIYSGSSPSPKAQYPPFRFSVEFGRLNELTYDKSVYSESSVFYCG
ncbi:hypothetical protein DFQ26_000594 [Actinomortierella ambigua]|nr:hypothetical protein DFQ26_000594 [Actinomortierella ambigua]